MEVMERLKRCGVVPVVVLDDAKDAVATAKALLAGGVDVMEGIPCCSLRNEKIHHFFVHGAGS